MYWLNDWPSKIAFIQSYNYMKRTETSNRHRKRTSTSRRFILHSIEPLTNILTNDKLFSTSLKSKFFWNCKSKYTTRSVVINRCLKGCSDQFLSKKGKGFGSVTHLRWDWISISLLNWCSTPAFSNWLFWMACKWING